MITTIIVVIITIVILIVIVLVIVIVMMCRCAAPSRGSSLYSRDTLLSQVCPTFTARIISFDLLVSLDQVIHRD